MNALAAGDTALVSALTMPVDPVTADSLLRATLDQLDHGAGAVPVISDTGTVIGWIRHRDLLSALSRSR